MSWGRAVRKAVLEQVIKYKSGQKLVRFLAKDYIAGSSLEEAFESIKQYASLGRKSTFDVLGEEAKTVFASFLNREAYKKAMDNVNPNDASISVKPTSICATSEKRLLESLEDKLETILNHAQGRNMEVTLDMEDNYWTDRSLEAAQTLWNKGYDNLGIVLQSRLNRTTQDIEDLFRNTEYATDKSKIAVRACIGIYTEPEDIATNNIPEAKGRLLKNIEQLFDVGVYVEVATHDHEVIQRVKELAELNGISKDRFEFQFLKGVQNAYNIEEQLRDEGYTVRFYMPAEIKELDGVPYMARRLIANPRMIAHGIKNIFQKVWNKIK